MPRVGVCVVADLQALDFDRFQVTSALIKICKTKCLHPVVLCSLHQSRLRAACQHVHVQLCTHCPNALLARSSLLDTINSARRCSLRCKIIIHRVKRQCKAHGIYFDCVVYGGCGDVAGAERREREINLPCLIKLV